MEAGDAFGGAVVLAGDVAAIGAYNRDTEVGTDAGVLYVFRRSGTAWSQVAELFPPDPQPYDYVGRFLALDGDTLIDGVPFHDTPAGEDAGAAYVRWKSALGSTESRAGRVPNPS